MARIGLFLGLAMTCTVLASGTVLAAPAPKLAVASFAQLAQPLPYPYDEAADAKRDVAAAKARALKNRRLLLIDLGGNWCGDCRVLAGTMALPELARFVRSHYVVVTVDVGRFTKNLDIPAAYGIARPEGVPALMIIDPRNNKLINAGHATALADARSMSPQALADWLAGWTK